MGPLEFANLDAVNAVPANISSNLGASLVLLAMAAASVAAASDQTLANQSLLFNLSFDFDATLSRSFKLLSVEIYARVCAIIDAVPWNDVLTLRSLEELEPMIDNNYPGVSDSIVKIGKKLVNLTRKR